MPELSEVERARKDCHENCVGKKIVEVETQDDSLVFAKITHKEFGEQVLGKTMVDTKRWGKYFVLVLNEGPAIVAHFGMTGNIQFEGKLAYIYKTEVGAKNPTWPPRFWKFILHFEDPITNESVKMSFNDARRLGRVRLVSDPMNSFPISELGFDPLHNLPDLPTFKAMVQKRSMPIKALLLDQSFSAGIGNWIADEVLYQSRIHPSQPTNHFTDTECATLRDNILYVCKTAVEANAESAKFPPHWLFSYRWNKGRDGAVTADGEKIKFEKVGGRTSAFVPVLQKLRKINTKTSEKPARVTKRKSTVDEEDEDPDNNVESEKKLKRAKSKSRR